MNTKIACTLVGLAGGLLLFGEMKAVASIDIAVSRLGLTSGGAGGEDWAYYGTSGGIRAFSIASTACNVGTQTAQWIDGNSGNHPVIAQNMYRLLNGRFEQIGQSWLKHSFCAVSEFTCGACSPTSCSTLGIGCADTYWATLNDGASGGPKSQINPAGVGSGGTHTDPHSFPSGPTAIRGRLQIHDADINAGGQNFAEVHYVTHDESLNDRNNNASWREVNLNLTSIFGVGGGQASVHFQEPAILAWEANDPGVAIVPFSDANGRGRFHLGYRVTDNGDGTWHYEYALHNMNSDRGANSFSVPIPAGVTVTNEAFHDVGYHSGEQYSGTDWPVTIGGAQIEWATLSEIEYANANALRWGTLYNFRFDADQPPTSANIEIGHFKGGEPPSMTVPAQGPLGPVLPCPTDINGDGATDDLDLFDLLPCFGLPAVAGCEAQDVNNDSTVNVRDLIELLLEFGNACP